MNDRSTRRRFVSQWLRAGAVALSTPAALRAADPKSDHDVGRNILKSLKWNMVKLDQPTEQKTTEQKFEILRQLGYDGVELDCPGGVDPDEAIAARDKTGLPIEGIVNSTHWRVRHSDPNPKVRKQALANMSEAIRYAAQVAADSVLLVPGKVTDPEHENHDQVWQRSIADIRKLIPLAERSGVQILIENVGNGFCESPESFAQYIDEIDSPWVGIHFDIGNHIRISPPATWIRVLGKRIKKLDVKDRTKQNERTLIGQGDADWPSVRDALAQLNYKGWAAAEVPGGDAITPGRRPGANELGARQIPTTGRLAACPHSICGG